MSIIMHSLRHTASYFLNRLPRRESFEAFQSFVKRLAMTGKKSFVLFKQIATARKFRSISKLCKAPRNDGKRRTYFEAFQSFVKRLAMPDTHRVVIARKHTMIISFKDE